MDINIAGERLFPSNQHKQVVYTAANFPRALISRALYSTALISRLTGPLRRYITQYVTRLLYYTSSAAASTAALTYIASRITASSLICRRSLREKRSAHINARARTVEIGGRSFRGGALLLLLFFFLPVLFARKRIFQFIIYALLQRCVTCRNVLYI